MAPQGSSPFPFAGGKKTEEKAKATEAPAETAAAATTEAAPTPKTKKSGEDRKKPAKVMTKEQIQSVLGMVKTKSYTEIADELGITKHQVNRVLMEVKKSLKASAEGDPAKMAKVEAFIKENLSRPEDTRPGSTGPKGGKVKNAFNDIVGDILAGL